MKSFSISSLLVTMVISLSLFLGCDGMNTSSEDAPNTFSVVLQVSGQDYKVTDTDMLYVNSGGTTVSIPAQNAAYVGTSDQLADSGTIVEVQVNSTGPIYSNGNSFTIHPNDQVLVTIEGYVDQVLAVVVPDGRFNGELALRNRTWGDEYTHLSLHYVGAGDVLEVQTWGLTGWKAGSATITGSSITAVNNNGNVTTGGDAVSMTPNAGVVGDVWVTLVKVYSAQIHIWVASGTMPARDSTGNIVRLVASYSNGSSIIGFAAPTSFTGNSIQVTITGTVFGTLTTWIGLDASGYGVEYLGEPRGAGQSYTITVIAGQGVDTTPIVVTAN